MTIYDINQNNRGTDPDAATGAHPETDGTDRPFRQPYRWQSWLAACSHTARNRHEAIMVSTTAACMLVTAAMAYLAMTSFAVIVAKVRLPWALVMGLGCCLLYTSDAADDLLCVDLGGRRIIKKK